MSEPEHSEDSFDYAAIEVPRDRMNYSTGFEEKELPREPLYGGRGIDSFKLRDAPIHLYDRCKDSLLFRGGDGLAKTLKHYASACDGAGILDSRAVTDLKTLAKEIEQAQGFNAKKQVFEERVRPFLLGLTMKKIGGK